MKLPTKNKSEIFNLRLDLDTKLKLEELSKTKNYKNNCSEVIRSLILSAFTKK